MLPLWKGQVELGFPFENDDMLLVDERANTYFYVRNLPKYLGGGTFYLTGIRDKQGELYNNKDTYRLNVPKDTPAKYFWSVIVYSMKTKGFACYSLNCHENSTQRTDNRIANILQKGDFTYMNDLKNKIDQIQQNIEQLRDEAKLKAHLGKAEAEVELAKLEDELNAFLGKFKPFTDEAEKTLENTSTAISLAVEELKEGFERVRKLF